MKVALAVVVTYNRLDCLKACVEALLAQTRKDFDILIVNNGSTDGTKEWIETLPSNILRIHQENLGGAGGFYRGQKYAFDNDYEWTWMMDDDGVPAKDQFEILLDVANRYNQKIIGPVVANINNPQEQAFSPGQQMPSKEPEFSLNPAYVSAFNGVMFHRDVMQKIGFIKKELFIWGDEREYTFRWRMNGFVEAAAMKAIHYHPQIKSQYDKVLPWGRAIVVLKPEKFSKYFYRNNGYINRKYASTKVLIGEMLLYSIYFLRKLRLLELAKYVKYYMKGAYFTS